MKGHSEHSITELLRRWLRGDARAVDERRLDEAAAGDNFLRDAMEGLRRQPQVDHAAATERLHQRLHQRRRRRGAGIMVLLPRMAAAATVTLLLGIALWAWLRPEPAKEELAVVEPLKNTPVPDISAPPADTAPATVEPEKTRTYLPAPPPTRQPPAKKMPAPSAIAATEEATPEITSIAPSPAADLAELEPAAKPAISGNDSLKPQAKAAGSTARSLTAPPPAPLAGLRSEGSPRTLTGQILTPRGEPVIAANVVLKGSTTGALTDQNGRFAIPLPEGQQSLTVSYLGFTTQEVAVARDDDSLRIVLEESPAMLDEMVVTGFSRPKGAAGARKEADSSPQPTGGFPALERFLRKNLVYPPAARQQRVEGTVRLEFSIQPDGMLTDFRVLDSLGYGCDAEAIRLLREGPKWQAPSGGERKTTFEVSFQLPKR